jgi:probable rRNA maturation factor
LIEPSCVSIINHVKSYNVNIKKIKDIAIEICERLSIHHYEVSLQFIGPARMKTINKQFRHKDKSTDVLSFPQYEWKKPLLAYMGRTPKIKRRILNPMPLGDVVISISDAERNAKESKHGLDEEICFLMIHGILHLVGHDHMKPLEKKIMFREQKKLMKHFSAPSSTIKFKSCVTKKRKAVVN